MAAENKKSLSSTPVDDSAVNNLSFSVDSLQLGDSTRSLLSPLYNNDKQSLKEPSLNSEDEELSEGEIVDKSMSSKSSSDSDHSEIITVKKGKSSSHAYSSASFRSSVSPSSFNSSRCSASSRTVTPTTSNKSGESGLENETVLSPWEKWLMNKIIEERGKAKHDSEKKKLDREMVAKEMAKESEKERKAEVVRKEWLELKTREEKIRKELKRREENARDCKEQEEDERIQRKAEESYEKWRKTKRHERGKLIKNRKKEEYVRKEKADERKEQSREAYEEWLNKAKSHQKSINNHFGYLSGKVTGYYDWTCYPMPLYNNPNPWVSPKIKRYRGIPELQCPSPPLLFKELEEREKTAREEKIKRKTTNKGV